MVTFFLLLLAAVVVSVGVAIYCVMDSRAYWKGQALHYAHVADERMAREQKTRNAWFDLCRQRDDARQELQDVHETRGAALRHLAEAVKTLQEHPGFDKD